MSSAPRNKPRVPSVADLRQNSEATFISQFAVRPRPSTLDPSIACYVCTVTPLCRRSFDNYNHWAQHETSFHRIINIQHEDATETNDSEKADIKKKFKSEPQKAITLHQADAQPITYDIWYCDGVDGCTTGWSNLTDFEAHFCATHAVGWNRLPRSMLSSDYLLGPKHGVRFWCGFCRMVLEVSRSEMWYYDRLAHVASHFDGTCLDEVWDGDVHGWVDVEIS